jgi:chitinase
MTYDLHGQWDYGNTFSKYVTLLLPSSAVPGPMLMMGRSPGCPNGNCLRSHVNKTEIEYTLAMITKANISSTRIVPGLALYGRAFQMTDPSCTGVACTFTGPLSGAPPGDCTQTYGPASTLGTL